MNTINFIMGTVATAKKILMEAKNAISENLTEDIIKTLTQYDFCCSTGEVHKNGFCEQLKNEILHSFEMLVNYYSNYFSEIYSCEISCDYSYETVEASGEQFVAIWFYIYKDSSECIYSYRNDFLIVD